MAHALREAGADSDDLRRLAYVACDANFTPTALDFSLGDWVRRRRATERRRSSGLPRVSGTIPFELFSMLEADPMDFDLGGTQLSGTIPSQIGVAEGLRSLQARRRRARRVARLALRLVLSVFV